MSDVPTGARIGASIGELGELTWHRERVTSGGLGACPEGISAVDFGGTGGGRLSPLHGLPGRRLTEELRVVAVSRLPHITPMFCVGRQSRKGSDQACAAASHLRR
jgi:hypothetical protein